MTKNKSSNPQGDQSSEMLNGANDNISNDHEGRVGSPKLSHVPKGEVTIEDKSHVGMVPISEHNAFLYLPYKEGSIIIIEPVTNGAVVTQQDGTKNAYVFDEEAQDFESKGLKGLVELLYAVLDHMGVYGGKYKTECIEIRIVHGRGYECKDKKCPICKENKER
jgi:hypothetical protein